MKKLIIIIGLLIISIYLNAQTIYENGDITKDTIKVEEVVVTGSYSAVKTTPFTFKNINDQEIKSLSFGTDPAVILSSTPSVTWYSDNGDGYGYTYWRLRGIDQSRLNSTLNGVPLNEPEDQGIYYNNYGGFLNAISSIQLIRGAGLSKPGVASYGGSINFNSLEFADKVSGFTNIIYGLDNTKQLNVGINTPTIFVTASWMNNDGFKEHSYNQSKSVFYGGKAVREKNKFYLYGFVGKQENGMGWIGEPLDSLNINPFYNSNTEDEKDDFTQIHNQISWENEIFKTTIYHTYLKGWYTTDIAHFDTTLNFGELINKIDLQSNWIGTIINVNPIKGNFNTNLGISTYTYTREHAGFYNEELAYENSGTRNEVAPYIKANLKWKDFLFYGDIQYRYTSFSYDGFFHMKMKTWNFLNWSGGITYRLNEKTYVYYGVGQTNREPTRSDLSGGNDDIDTLYNISPETCLSNELGIKYNTDDFYINSNLYYMKFKNEIVLNGKYGFNSIALHQNVPESFRSGLEIDAKYKTLIGFDLSTATTLAFNKINVLENEYTPIMSPSVLFNGDIVYNIGNFGYIGFNARYTSKTYIDYLNEYSIPSYIVYTGYAGIIWKGFELKGFINNLTGERVINNANIGFDGEVKYFATQFRFWTISLTYKF